MNVPKTQAELQELVNVILQGLGDIHKVQVKLSTRLHRYHALADTPHYIKTGRRRIKVGTNFLGHTKSLKDVINLILHECAHFKYKKTRRLRKLWLKKERGDIRLVHYIGERSNLLKKHDHTKSFRKLEEKLKDRFYSSPEAEQLDL